MVVENVTWCAPSLPTKAFCPKILDRDVDCTPEDHPPLVLYTPAALELTMTRGSVTLVVPDQFQYFTLQGRARARHREFDWPLYLGSNWESDLAKFGSLRDHASVTALGQKPSYVYPRYSVLNTYQTRSASSSSVYGLMLFFLRSDELLPKGSYHG